MIWEQYGLTPLCESDPAFQKPPPGSTAWHREGSGTLELQGIESKALVPALRSKLLAESTLDYSLPWWTLEKTVPISLRRVSHKRTCHFLALGMPSTAPLSWVYFLKPLPVPSWDPPCELGTKGTIYPDTDLQGQLFHLYFPTIFSMSSLDSGTCPCQECRGWRAKWEKWREASNVNYSRVMLPGSKRSLSVPS